MPPIPLPPLYCFHQLFARTATTFECYSKILTNEESFSCKKKERKLPTLKSVKASWNYDCIISIEFGIFPIFLFRKKELPWIIRYNYEQQALPAFTVLSPFLRILLPYGQWRFLKYSSNLQVFSLLLQKEQILEIATYFRVKCYLNYWTLWH